MSDIRKLVEKLSEVLDTGVNCEDCIFQCDSTESCTLSEIKNSLVKKSINE